jgi:regulator of protease activity HflC (stomatin/prohibitin superfamily)
MQHLSGLEPPRPNPHKWTLLMVDDRTEDLLREFLGKEKKAEAAGYTREAVLKAVDKVGLALQEHQKDCTRRWEENERRHLSAEKRLRSLEASQEGTHIATATHLSPGFPVDDPAEITGAHRIDDIATKVKQATIESLRVPGADPETAIRAVVAEEQEALAKRAELKRLQKEENDRAADAATAAREKRERNRLILVGIASVVGGAGVLGFIQLVASHVH